MPILVANGKQYRVPFMSLMNLKSNVREERLPYGISAGTSYYPELPLVTANNPAIVEAYHPYQPVGVIPRPSGGRARAHSVLYTLPDDIPWTADDDRLLRKLRVSGVPWRRISTVMDDRPIEELKARWAGLRKRGRNVHEVYGSSKIADDWYFDDDDDEEEDRRVSFRRMRVEDSDDDDASSRPSKIKMAYYIDNNFTLDEVLLLHRIAADWRKDRWKTISSRFNDMTGRNITPAQVKSVVEE
ncbi:hypothetical protein BJY01DRAFT_216016 [Aspergillus pseudoustus]|uniref:Myb-like domain-containing protein n=1 Tax=Aspergillus pseudoustus TaxID=1810923 RepID=A0ABR4JU43_9EURO